MDASVSELLWNVAIVFYIYFNLSSVSQSSLSGKFWVYKKVMLLPLLLLLGLFFLKVKLFLASVSSSRMVTCLLLVSFSIWRSVWFYFLFPVCVRVCVFVCVRPLPVHTTLLALFILYLIFYAFNSPPFTFLSFLVFFFTLPLYSSSSSSPPLWCVLLCHNSLPGISNHGDGVDSDDVCDLLLWRHPQPNSPCCVYSMESFNKRQTHLSLILCLYTVEWANEGEMKLGRKGR